MALDLNLTPPNEDEDGKIPEEVVPIPEEAIPIPVEKAHHRELPDSHKFGVYLALKALGKDRPITKADKKHVAALLETSLTTVRRIWTSAKKQESDGKRTVEVDVSSKKKGNCGRKTTELGLSRVRSIELNKRSTLRGLARELNVAYSTLQRRFQWGGFLVYKVCSTSKNTKARDAFYKKPPLTTLHCIFCVVLMSLCGWLFVSS